MSAFPCVIMKIHRTELRAPSPIFNPFTAKGEFD